TKNGQRLSPGDHNASPWREFMRTRLESLQDERGNQTIRHASSNASRGLRGRSFVASPWPRLQRKFDLIVVPAKNASSTLALFNSDIVPQSRPSERAASMKYAPCREELRSAAYSSTLGGRSLNQALASACGNSFGSFS